MNKRISTILLTAALLLVSCSWEELPDFETIEKAQAAKEKQDKYDMADGQADSTYTLQRTAYEDSCAAAAETEETPRQLCCYMQVWSKLRVEGGSTVDITGSNITVRDIRVRLKVDEADSIYSPTLLKEVAEPDDAVYWENMPVGIGFGTLPLCETWGVLYDSLCEVEVTVTYLLRSKDYDLVADCLPQRYECTVQAQTTGEQIEKLNITVPLVLSTIEMGASVAEEQEGNR